MNKRRLLSLLILTSTLFYTISCHQPLAEKNATYFKATSDSYQKEWQKIDSLEKRGLAKDILLQLDNLMQKAGIEKNHLQLFKILAYQSKHLQHIEEDALETIFQRYESKAQSSGFPTNQIFHSALAEMYFWYYQQNRWKFSNRSQTVEFDKGKLSTWDLNSIMERIISHYDSSLSQANELQLIPIKQIDEILVDPKSKFDDYELKLRPTLYDFLAHRALDFYRSGEGDVLFPLDTFNINESFYQKPPKYSLIDLDQLTASGFQEKTLAIYRSLMAFHHENGNEAALNHLSIKRLDYLRNNFELAEEDSLFLFALSQLKNSAKKSEGTAELNHSLAQFYYQESLDELEKEKKGQYRILAHKLAKENLDKFPESFGGQQSKALIQQLESQHLGFQTSNAFPVKEWSLINIEHQNIPVAYFKIIKSPHAALEYNERDPEAKIKLYNSIPAVYNDTIRLQSKKDYLEHQDVYPMPKLSQGRYILILSNHPNFNSEKHIVSYRDVWISNLSFISRTYNNKIELRSLDRISGQALRNLKVEAWKRNYEPSKREYVFVRQESKFTDHEGMVSFESSNSAENLIFLLSDGKDSLVSDEMYRIFNSSNKAEKRISSTFFLDRAIYRPGQTVYFKAIHVEEKNDSKKLASGINSTVKLWDVNGRELSALELRTNEYGSISGFFVLPSSGLTGNFRIGNEHGQQFFSVEEYKRPTFKIEFDSIATAYQLNSSVPISGKLMSYTGDNIPGAEVNYSVFGSVHYPYPYFSRGFFPRETEMLIGNGTVRADSAGQFDFEFLAKKKMKSKADPKALYNFRVSVTATARNGETQISNLDIMLSDQGFYIQTDIQDVVISDSLKSIKVSALNPSGVAIDETIHLLVQKVETEGQLFLPKLYDQAESDLMDSIDFKLKFPYLAYSSEDEINSWPKSQTILKKSIPANNSISLPHLKSGIYYLNIYAIDQNSDTVSYEKYFRVHSLNEKELPEEKAFRFFALENKVEVGDTARFILGSSFREATVFWDLEVNGKLLESRKIVLQEEQKIIEFPIMEIHRGGFSVHVNMVKQNRAFGNSSIIEVPYTNKKLSLELTKSKNEIKPGAEEEWQINIIDQEGKVAKAELMVSMYDASLDKFREHQWDFNIFDHHRPQLGWNLHSSFQVQYSINFTKERIPYFEVPQHGFPYLNWYGFHLAYGRYYYGMPEMLAQDVSIQRDKSNSSVVEESLITEDIDTEIGQKQTNLPQNENIAIRKNFKETAFFYPNLRADDSGNYSFKFKVPDALTEWNFMAFAHNVELQHGQLNEKIISKKELMVFPNMPRFFRSGDSLLVSTKIVGNAENYMNGQVKIQFMDAINDSMNMNLLNDDAEIKYFKVKKNDPAILQWMIAIPEQSGAIRYRITAKTEKYSDAEEKVIPVLSNKILITESMPMSIRGNSTEYFQMEKLFSSNKSKTLENHRLTFEFSANPIWYAIQALPYIMENESDNSEKIFSRYFSNALSAHIVKTHPEIEKVFKHWKEHEPNALLSALEKNEELKSIALEESPWLMEAKNETERKAKLAVLFDENRMAMEKRSAIQKLSKLQLSNGGWPWFANGPDDRYITQYILGGFGELKKAGVLIPDNETATMLRKAVEYIDQRAYEDYIKSQKQDSIKQLGSIDIHYLYTRSFFPEIQENSKTKEIHTLYIELLEDNWLEQSIYMKAMTALTLSRAGKVETAKAIMESLRQTAIVDEDLGMYWKENQNGYYWHQSKIETQAMLMKAFREIESEMEAVAEMKIWLLKQKQTNNWGNSKATAQACYAIISTESKPIYTESRNLEIEIGKLTIDPTEKETASAYYKKIWDADEIKPNMANVKIKKESDGIAWGALYWQYFEDVDKISHAGTTLDLQKELFVEKIMDGGKKLLPIENNKVKIGDRIVVRIVLRTDRNLEYIHMKDMRASGLEPTENISMHKLQDGLFYYQSIKDASTNFFFNYLPKGIHVFEYSLIANVEGEFSNGITQVQCMYAPEFSSHSKSSEIHIQGSN